MNRRLTRASVLAVALFITLMSSAFADSGGAKTYSSPQQAVDAFIKAVRSNDTKALISIFGKDSARLFDSGDSTADTQLRAEFLKLYDSQHDFTSRADGSKVLNVGAIGWPFPIPLVQSGSHWSFDSSAGLDEIINRRIGRNELATIQTVLAVADAQREYFSVDRDGDGILEYAQSFRSTVGLHNGLFWPAETDEPASPLGMFVATASEEGYPPSSSSYHGYHYKLLSAQGPSAPGGAYDYMAHDSQIGGFAVAAFPAAYGDTGIMTFMLSHSGVLYQKDLGPDTEAIMDKVTVFDPGEGWTVVSDKDKIPFQDTAP